MSKVYKGGYAMIVAVVKTSVSGLYVPTKVVLGCEYY